MTDRQFRFSLSRWKSRWYCWMIWDKRRPKRLRRLSLTYSNKRLHLKRDFKKEDLRENNVKRPVCLLSKESLQSLQFRWIMKQKLQDSPLFLQTCLKVQREKVQIVKKVGKIKNKITLIWSKSEMKSLRNLLKRVINRRTLRPRGWKSKRWVRNKLKRGCCN